MFERYTEQSRRALFFARYESSQLGSPAIETEHLLLGIIRESHGFTSKVLARSVSIEELRRDIESRSAAREPIPSSVEIPFTVELQRVLRYAAEEADRLKHDYIGTEHLLLGLLREERSVAGSVLAGRGVQLDDVRTTVAELSRPPAEPSSDVFARVRRQIDDIKELVGQLAQLAHDSREARLLAARITDSLDALKRRL